MVGIGGNTAQAIAPQIFNDLRTKPIILRAGVAEGLEIRFVVGTANLGSGGVQVAIHMTWTEE
jgi:hypothetical protein